MEFSTLHDPRGCRVRPAIRIAAPHHSVPRLDELGSYGVPEQVRSPVDALESISDPRGACGVRYRLSSLLALLVRAMTTAGHDSITAAAEWCHRAAPEELAAFDLPYHPLLGRYRVPSEKTLRGVLGGHSCRVTQDKLPSATPDPPGPTNNLRSCHGARDHSPYAGLESGWLLACACRRGSARGPEPSHQR